jgi:hypothetical protein
MHEMPLYVCHKEVRATRISGVVSRGTDTTTDENPVVEVYFHDARFEPRKVSLRGKPTPEAGWWWVDYGDYFSFSPNDKFEAGYTLKLEPEANPQVQ